MKSEVITSTANPRVKAVARLRNSRERRQSGLILIDGCLEITRAMAAGVKIHEVYFHDGDAGVAGLADLLAIAATAGARRIEVSNSVFGKISYGDRTEGVVATAERPARTLAGLRLSECPLIAVVEGLEKPGNLGAIVRSADGAGVEAVIAVNAVADLFSPNAIHASRGAVFSLPIVETSVSEGLSWLRDIGLQIVAARPDGAIPYFDIDFRMSTAIVLGTEAQGLSAAWNGDDIFGAYIPMLGHGDSLNVSTTSAVLFYEALRQRSLGG